MRGAGAEEGPRAGGPYVGTCQPAGLRGVPWGAARAAAAAACSQRLVAPGPLRRPHPHPPEPARPPVSGPSAAPARAGGCGGGARSAPAAPRVIISAPAPARLAARAFPYRGQRQQPARPPADGPARPAAPGGAARRALPCSALPLSGRCPCRGAGVSSWFKPVGFYSLSLLFFFWYQVEKERMALPPAWLATAEQGWLRSVAERCRQGTGFWAQLIPVLRLGWAANRSVFALRAGAGDFRPASGMSQPVCVRQTAVLGIDLFGG